jgi:hypothetical protein
MPKDQSKKSHVKKSAKSRAYENNAEDLDEITKELYLEWDKKELNKEIVIGRIQLAHGFMFQVECKNKVLQVATPGNMALHDMIKQFSSGTHTNQELQPYILIKLPNPSSKTKTGETLALISDVNPDVTAFRLAKLQQCGIDMDITKKETQDTGFDFEEEVALEDL